MDGITLSNWRTSPASRRSFVNIDRLIPTKTISKSSRPSQLEHVTSRSKGLVFGIVSTFSGLRSVLEETSTDSVILLHHGKVLHEYYDHGNNAESKHIFMSMTKAMTGLIVSSLIDRGLLKAEDRVTKHLPELENTAFAPASIRDLLDMRSGVKYSDDTAEYRTACYWDACPEGEKQLSFPELFSNLNPPDTDVPNNDFNYASVNTDVLGLLLERVSGKSYSELAQEFLFQPAGAAHDGLITTDKAGNPRAAGGLAASIEDLARIGQALLDSKIVRQQRIEQLLSGGDKDAFARSDWKSFRGFASDMTYSSGFLASKKDRLLMAVGIHGQMLVVDFKNELVMAKFSSQPGFFDPVAVKKTLTMVRLLQYGLKLS